MISSQRLLALVEQTSTSLPSVFARELLFDVRGALSENTPFQVTEVWTSHAMKSRPSRLRRLIACQVINNCVIAPAKPGEDLFCTSSVHHSKLTAYVRAIMPYIMT